MNSNIKAKFGRMTAVAAVLCAGFSVTAQANTTNLGPLSVPGTYTYADSFNAPTPVGSPFYDDYTFTVPVADFDTIAATINLGSFFDIVNLSARLYSGSGPFASGVTPLLQAWSTPFNAGPASGQVVVINPIALGAGTYTLELRGNVTGLAGGSYSGSLNLTPASPVPEPSSKVAILAGLGLLGVQLSRKMKSHS